MKGLKQLIPIILACISSALASPSTATNEILNDNRQHLLKVLDTHIYKALVDITKLRANLVRKRGVMRFKVDFAKNKCQDIVSILTSLDGLVKDAQIMQLAESKTAPMTFTGKDGQGSSNYVDNLRSIEYSVRNIACDIRRLAKDYKKVNLPKYTIGLSQSEAENAQKTKQVAAVVNKEAYKKLTVMKKCLKVFKKKFIASRIVEDPIGGNMIGNMYSMFTRQHNDFSNNNFVF